MKFLVLYQAPAGAIEEWMQLPEETRKKEEQQMQQEWNAWMAAHRELLTETAGAGKTKRVTKEGVTDTKNDVMLYSIAEGNSAEEVASAFVGHPHFGIPGATIDVMPSNALSGMS